MQKGKNKDLKIENMMLIATQNYNFYTRSVKIMIENYNLCSQRSQEREEKDPMIENKWLMQHKYNFYTHSIKIMI